MSSIKFGFISKQENQQKINEYNKKALLQVENIVANQKRMIENQKRFIENQKRFIENQKIAALNQPPKPDVIVKPQPPKPDVIVKPQPPKPQQSNSNIIKLDVKVNSFKFV